MCPPLEDHHFQNQECSSAFDMTNDNWLHCLTRSDVQTSLFDKVVFKKTPESKNLNDVLDFDITGFWCNTTADQADQHFLNWTWRGDTVSDLKRIDDTGDLPFCLLKDNTEISTIELSRLLKNDISFKFRSKLTGWRPHFSMNR